MDQIFPGARRAIRIALVELYEPDARWFTISVEEADIAAATIVRYSTGISALHTWRKDAGAVDIIVVADVLPMLTLVEFVNAARTIHGNIPIVIAGEPSGPEEMSLANIHWSDKPLSIDSIRSLQRIAAGLQNASRKHGLEQFTDRRKQPRSNTDLRAAIRVLDRKIRIYGRILDFTDEGMAIFSPEPLRPGAPLAVTYRDVLILAEAMYCIPFESGHRAGLKIDQAMATTTAEASLDEVTRELRSALDLPKWPERMRDTGHVERHGRLHIIDC